MTEKTTTPTEFVPDEDLLWFIDNLGGDVVKWGAHEDSNEYYPHIYVEIDPDGI